MCPDMSKINKNTKITPVLRGQSPLQQRKSDFIEQVILYIKRGPIHMTFSMTGQEKGDL